MTLSCVTSDKELDAMAVFFASSAAKVESTDVIICWDRLEAASLSATSAAIAAAVFFEISVADDPLEFVSTIGSLLSRRLMFAASSTCA